MWSLGAGHWPNHQTLASLNVVANDIVQAKECALGTPSHLYLPLLLILFISTPPSA